MGCWLNFVFVEIEPATTQRRIAEASYELVGSLTGWAWKLRAQSLKNCQLCFVFKKLRSFFNKVRKIVHSLNYQPLAESAIGRFLPLAK